MNVFHRALLYLIRKRTRTILLFLLFFFMGLFMLSCWSIYKSARAAEESMRKNISTGLELRLSTSLSGADVYELNHNKNGEIVRSLKLPLITTSIADELANLPGVSGYYSEQGTSILYTGLDVTPCFYTQYLKELEISDNISPEEISGALAWSQSNSYLLVAESEYYPYFQNGAMELVEGRHLHSDDTRKILISEELAARNHLAVHDRIDGQCFDVFTGKLYGEIYQSEIVGIFRINFEQQLSDYTLEPDILANTVFAPYELSNWDQIQYNTYYGNEILAQEADPLLDTITLFVEDPDRLSEVETALESYDKVDWNYYTIQRYDEDYKAVTKPLRTMRLLAALMAGSIIMASLLVLSLVTAMWMQNRKQEIQILTSLGFGRRQILAQFFTETAIIVTIAFLTSCLLAAPVTTYIGDTMTAFTNPTENTPAFTVTSEAETSVIHVNRTPQQQDPLSYHISYHMAGVTYLAMIILSSGTAFLSFQKVQKKSFTKQHIFAPFIWRFRASADADHCRTKKIGSHHRAFLYLSRKPAKNFLLFLIFFLTNTLFLTGICVHSASENAAFQLREHLGGYFTLTPDYQSSTATNQINSEMINIIMGFEEIKAANAMDICYMNVTDISLQPGRFTEKNDQRACMTRVLGNTDSRLSEYFSLEILELTEGSPIQSTDREKALISAELAHKNHLDIGDSIVIHTTDDDVNNGISAENYELEIVGIFTEKVKGSSSTSEYAECDILANYIFTDIYTTQQIMQDFYPDSDPVYSGGASFYVKDPKTLDALTASLENSNTIDLTSTKITKNNAVYQRNMEPLTWLSDQSLLLLIIISSISIILLTLILLLRERERLHETGILMSFGLSSRIIWYQRVIECITLFFISLLLSVALLLPAASKTGDWLYTQTLQQTEQTDETDIGSDSTALSIETVESELINHDISFRLELSPSAVLTACFAGIALTGISVSIVFVTAVRRNPKQLLTIME